jgi:hypothetical protein
MRTTHKQHNLNHVRSIGIPVVIAIGSCFVSMVWLTGDWAYSTYLQPKVAVIEVSESRKELEAKHRELLNKSGFKSDVNLKSVTDASLKAANYKLEKALRAGL